MALGEAVIRGTEAWYRTHSWTKHGEAYPPPCEDYQHPQTKALHFGWTSYVLCDAHRYHRDTESDETLLRHPGLISN